MKDNQFKAPATGLTGIFSRIARDANNFYSSVDHLTTAHAKKLLVPIRHEDDYTVIPVVVHSIDGSVYTVEDGVVTGRSIDVQDTDDDFDQSDEWRERERDEKQR